VEELRHAWVSPVQEPQRSGEGAGRVRRRVPKPALQKHPQDAPRKGRASGYGGLESILKVLQGYLAHKKHPPLRTLR